MSQASDSSTALNQLDISRICPLSGEKKAFGVPTDERSVRSAVARARAAQASWEASGFETRRKLLKKGAKKVLAERSVGIEQLAKGIGKLEVEAIMSELLGVLDQVQSWSSLLRPLLSKQSVSLNPLSFPGKSASYLLEARGVFGVIAPWNYPTATFFRNVIPALLCGNAVVVKPSEWCDEASDWFLKTLGSALPDGVLEVIHGGAETGTFLIDSGIDALNFTGSVKTGKIIMGRCGEKLIPCNVELGGNDPAIVLADADIERSLAGITHWSLHNAGQACGAIELLLVEEGIADEFITRLKDCWSKLTVGPKKNEICDVSPMATLPQLEQVELQVQDALKKGAKLLCGGERVGPGLGYAPTLLDRCTPEMAVVQDESFGPILAIIRVKSARAAIDLANSLQFGLTASIWTSDLVRAQRLAERLDFGVITINNHSVSGAIVGLPWSGRRNTGPGISNSPLSVLNFTKTKTILVDSNKKPELYFMPFDRELLKIGHTLCDAQIGKILGAVRLPLMINRRVASVISFFRR